MPSKAYFSAIAYAQEVLLFIGISILLSLPIVLAYFPDALGDGAIGLLFEISLSAALLVMCVRPLADLFPNVAWLRPLVILRKGVGVVSASIIVSFMLSRAMVDPSGYLSSFFSAARWDVPSGAVLAPLGDVSALVLLVTSNRYSKRALGPNWKRVQKLAYVYFYAGALYEYLLLGQGFALVYALVTAALTVAAFVKKRLPEKSGAPVPA